jgi:hypothetical protein
VATKDLWADNAFSKADADAFADLYDATVPLKITQAAYNALGSGRPQRLYVIVG